MINRKIKILLIVIFLTSTISSLIIVNKYEKKAKMLPAVAFMVYDEEQGEYVKSGTVPQGEFVINRNKSNCISGGKIKTYNSSTGIVTYEIDAGDKCILYFDIYSPIFAVNYLKQKVYIDAQGNNNPEGTAGLYYHDDTLEGSANDNSYRYSGPSNSVNNYICFDGNDCTKEDNLYRIIGVFGNNIKVIKLTDIGIIPWNTKSADATGNTNNWQGSSLEEYLNSEYLSSLGTAKNIIINESWSVGGFDSSLRTTNAKTINDAELLSSPKVIDKIGLMYVGDYMYASLPEYYSYPGYISGGGDIRKGKDTNWMWSDNFPWTISRNSSGTDGVYRIGSYGHITYNSVNTIEMSVRPSFLLSASALLLSGNGSKETPYIIGSNESPTLTSYIKNNIYKNLQNNHNPNGTSGVYLHDNSLENGAFDNAYRYAGPSPDNYVCFMSDDCTNEENIYRIIGVFGENVKLIKETSIIKTQYNSNEANADGKTNYWVGSSLELYLNNQTSSGYLGSLSHKEKNIKPTIWSTSGVPFSVINNATSTSKIVFDEETSNTSVTNSLKIGLPYISDYMFATLPEYYNLPPYQADENDIRKGMDYNWLFTNYYYWTIPTRTDSSNRAYGITSGGRVGSYAVTDTRQVKPVFYLDSNVRVIDGVGAKTNPYIISQ